MAFFRPSDPFVRADALHLGSKLDFYLTKLRKQVIPFNGLKTYKRR
jgi:hypothetical protein